MNKLFTKFSIAIASAIASFYASACTEPNRDITGTAEERNQSANVGDITKESPTGTSDNIKIVDSLTNNDKKGHYEANSSTTATPTSSSNESSNTLTPGIAGSAESYSLNSYAQETGVIGVSFAPEVFAFNKTYESCHISTDSCSENQTIPEFREKGLHKVEQKDLEEIAKIFPKASIRLDSEIKQEYANGCSLYVLNIIDTSPSWHVLSSISSDTITIDNISDNCDYEARPFDMHVGFLFSFCNKFSEKTQIITKQNFYDLNPCGIASYEEYYKQ